MYSVSSEVRCEFFTHHMEKNEDIYDLVPRQNSGAVESVYIQRNSKYLF